MISLDLPGSKIKPPRTDMAAEGGAKLAGQRELAGNGSFDWPLVS